MRGTFTGPNTNTSTEALKVSPPISMITQCSWGEEGRIKALPAAGGANYCGDVGLCSINNKVVSPSYIRQGQCEASHSHVQC
jgi:hypothetical protein